MPYLNKDYYLNFYGGEPLLSFRLIEKTISLASKKNKELKKRASYSITTNGSLITEEVIQFFTENRFSVMLSFDGLAQDIQRQKGSFLRIVPVIEKLAQCPDIHFEVNSVFTPETVSYLSKSIKFIMDLGVPDINLSLSLITPWRKNSILELKEELGQLRKILISRYKTKGDIPVLSFREDLGKGIFYCAGGKDRLTVTPDEEIWGCQLFPDYSLRKEKSSESKKFFFGKLDDFIRNHEKTYRRIYSNYAALSTENYSTSIGDCFLCEEIEDCEICPVNAAFTGSPLMKIPAYVCEIQKIRIKEKRKFKKEISSSESRKKRL